MKLSSLISSVFLLCVLSISAWASTPPLPPKKKETLSAIETRMNAEKSEQKDLKSKAVTIEKDMGQLKKDMVALASDIRSKEEQSRELESRLAELQSSKDKITQSLKDQRKSIADLIVALERIRRLPPEALIAKPDAPLETAQAATLLSSILPELDRRAKKLDLDLSDLQTVEENLVAKQAALDETAKKLRADQKNLDQMLDSRQSMLKSTKQQVLEKEQAIAQLSRSAKDLNDLIAKVEQKNRDIGEERTANLEQNQNASISHNPVSTADFPALGDMRTPVSGTVSVKFGQRDDIGAISQGLTIDGRPGALVVAPLGGVVRYAGPFKKYGSIILLEHKNKFHSLVAGLGKIDTFVGQSVEAGEPLGRLPDYTGRLYYELRYRGKPVNPSQKHAKLN